MWTINTKELNRPVDVLCIEKMAQHLQYANLKETKTDMMPRLTLAMPLFCFCGAVLSAIVAWQELALLGKPLPSQKGFYESILSGENSFGPSAYSKMVALKDCSYGLEPIVVNIRGAENTAQFAAICMKTAAEITQTMPTNSYGWYVMAQAAAQLNDVDNFKTGYLNSFLTGPHEQWITVQRVDLAENNLAKLTPEMMAAHEKDIALLAVSTKGVQAIARRYVSDVNFRDRVTDIVAKLPDANQRRFLNLVRRSVKT
jgi:hypothetical protein